MPYGAGYAIADIAALKALTTANLVNGYARWVASKNNWYGWNSGSTLNANDDAVVALTEAPINGRFIKSVLLIARQTVTFTSPALAPQEKLDFNAPIGKKSAILSIKTNVPAWVRIYPNVAYRANDASRTLTQTPPNNYVAFVDVITSTANLETFIIPNASCSSMEITPLLNLSCTVVNLHSVSSVVTIDFIVVIEEV